MKLVALALGSLVALLGVVVLYSWLRPNRAEVDPALRIEHWPIVSDGQHNSNTDMIAWRDGFLLVHATSPWHLGSTRSRLLVKHSSDDGRSWETLARLGVPGHDIRDPKLAVIDGTLFLYALPNLGRMATPIGTLLATSRDGRDWTPFEPVGPEGWLFWRPKTHDGRTWYVSAYWKDHGRSILLRSDDGRAWQQVSEIHAGDGNDETAIEFLPDGRLVATARLEVTPDNVLGNDDAGTAIAVADPPYTEWSQRRSSSTRLDGPVLFRHEGRVFAVARWQPPPHGGLWKLGGALARKRTGLYRVEPERLVYLGDLPSAGDTSYAGVVLRDGALFTEYYTSRIDRDYPWLLGMFLPTELRMARIPLEALESVSDAHP
ncbi:MAG TPA: sialidase family protein [Myxococcota bacterium]|nr:sialidase family protein [Myxococcota bacterium]